MATRAIAFEFLLAGLRDPDTGEPLSGGTVEFYAVGTTTPKNVWTEEAKTNAYTSYTLDTNGVAELFGDGNYKIVIKDSAGSTEYTFSEVKMQSPIFNIRETSSSTDTATSDDDCIVCDCSSNNITLNLNAVSTFSRPLFIKKTGAGNTLTIDANGSETIDGSLTAAITLQNHGFWLIPIQSGGYWIKMNDVATNILNLAATAAELNNKCDDDDGTPTWTSATSAKPEVIFKNTNADANGTIIRGQKDSASPADNDELLQILATGDDSGANQTDFAKISIQSADVTNTDEAGAFVLSMLMDATLRQFLKMTGYNGSVNQGEIIFNEDGQDIDFRVESAVSANGLKIQGSDGAVTIAGAADVGGNLDIGAGTTRRAAPAGTSVNNANGNPNISDTAFAVDINVTISTWETIGPTGSGADNIWTALDSVPADADWIALRIIIQGIESSGTATTNRLIDVWIRDGDSSQGVAASNLIGILTAPTNASGDANYTIKVKDKVSLNSSGVFGIQWFGSFADTNSIDLYLIDWGFNP